MDPDLLLNRDRTTSLINLAILKRAMEVEGNKKFEEIKLLSQLTGIETAKILAKIFG